MVQKWYFKGEKSGQAMVELAVGLVAIMVLLGALIQIGRLIDARTRTMAAARAAAAYHAMSASPPPRPTQNRYIYNWHPGPDRRYYTRDDVAIVATSAVDAVRLAAEGAAVAGAPEPPDNPVGRLAIGLDPVGDFALLQSRETLSVPVLPVVRRLVYNRGDITVESEVWLVWTEGIY